MAGEDWSGTALNLSMSMELATLAGRGVEVKVILQVRRAGRLRPSGWVPGCPQGSAPLGSLRRGCTLGMVIGREAYSWRSA
jgi:hypothetical protein